MEIARIELDAPDGFVDGTQLAHGELARAERGGQRAVFQLCSGAFHPVAEDRAVIEGEASSRAQQQRLDVEEEAAGCIGAGDGIR